MTITAVAKKELRDAGRSHSLLALTALFVLFGGGLAALQWVPATARGPGIERTTVALLNSLRQPTVILVPMAGIALGYNVIAGERERGSVVLALGLPNSRRDLVVGKFLGRSAVVALSVLAGYAAVALVSLATYPTVDVAALALYTPLTVAHGSVFVAIGVGFSAWMDERPAALGGAVALYVAFLLGWDLVLIALQALTVGPTVPERGLPEWIQFVGLLNPANAFHAAGRALLPEYGAVTTLPESNAVYLQDWIGFVVLGLWTAVPLAVGALQFGRVDLP